MLVIALLMTILLGHAATHVRSNIVDISWPNCREKLADYRTGIIGVTGGRNFHPNPCLASESSHIQNYAVYINTGYPGKAYGRHFQYSPRHCAYNDTYCLAYNYGYNEALYAIHYANLNDVHTDTWWLDVETLNSWSDNFLANRFFINGAVAGIKQNIWSAKAGIYSAPLQWQQLMGPWKVKLPEWLATGGSSQAAATQACHNKAFTGGKIELTQYTQDLDQNILCHQRK